ncbi:MAG: trehalose-phosphatase [Deltaproteobacteria bacterium RIFOXYD12_FULL_57_12]|nr:MAG: trehalose-phosphatase [Deltaproteobacteria bacterium RIFOXYD12_FULL_57_12]
MQAKPLAGVLDVLHSLVNQNATAVAIISGRPAAEVLMLLDKLPVTIVGSHGFELWRPTDNTPVVIQPSAEQKVGLEKAKEAALQKGYGEKLEYKVASLAMHTRGLPAQVASAMEEGILAAWTGISSFQTLECRRFNGGVEIRCAGRHKGDALSELLRGQPPGNFPVYVGDDETDEDAFRIIRDTGIGIKVGATSASTAARGFLEDCAAVKKFLETWVSVTSTLRD